MRYAVFLPNFGRCGDPRVLVDLAQAAERSGWHGFFLWDHIQWDGSEGEAAAPGAVPLVDPWVALAAVAAATESLRLGTMVTPLARRRPWKLARETTTLDHLSGGRREPRRRPRLPAATPSSGPSAKRETTASAR